MRRDRRHPLPGLRPPTAPPAMRRRVLDAARAAAADGAGSIERTRTLVDRCWESRPLRLAWAALVVLVLAVNVLIGPNESADGVLSATVGREAPEGASTLLASREPVLRALLTDEPGDLDHPGQREHSSGRDS